MASGHQGVPILLNPNVPAYASEAPPVENLQRGRLSREPRADWARPANRMSDDIMAAATMTLRDSDPRAPDVARRFAAPPTAMKGNFVGCSSPIEEGVYHG